MSDFKYVGSELDLFANVTNWKSYWSSQVRPFLGRDILEVGAGLGSNMEFLDPDRPGHTVCLEPDPALTAQLGARLNQQISPRTREAVCGTLSSLRDRKFDTIVYIDVLEHIEADQDELSTAATMLNPGGRIVVLSPAHQSLYTPFDAAIGHFRRYDRSMLRAISPKGLRLEALRYLDSVGMFASSANRLFLQQSMPTASQLRFWDGAMVPVSTVIDRLMFYSIGKSILAVWQRPA
jgi:cyclopropane fatty-acyl-phospholipid synthase-like methyltransferase